MTWIIEHLNVVVPLWMLLGVISWGWQNHCAYADNPRADENSKKWMFLFWSPLLGPIMALMTFIICLVDNQWHFGLRFR